VDDRRERGNMKGIVYGVASVVLGTMAYVMVGIALAGIG
jgi:hypothetical protein